MKVFLVILASLSEARCPNLNLVEIRSEIIHYGLVRFRPAAPCSLDGALASAIWLSQRLGRGRMRVFCVCLWFLGPRDAVEAVIQKAK